MLQLLNVKTVILLAILLESVAEAPVWAINLVAYWALAWASELIVEMSSLILLVLELSICGNRNSEST